MERSDLFKNKIVVATLVAVAVALNLTAAWGGTLAGPIFNEGLIVDVEDLVQVPASSGSAPLARINMLHEAPDGSGRLFVNDLRGPLYVLDGGTLHTFMDMATERPLKTTPGLATGFVSFAFHPEFAVNGLFYTVHTEEVGGATPPNLGPAISTAFVQHAVLTEWNATDPAANSFNGTSRELMRIASTHRFHNMGEIAFNPNAQLGDADYGFLYIGGGDYGTGAGNGTNFPPQPEQLQRLDTPYGTLMRIDPLGGPFVRGSTTYNYGIPISNPFAFDGDPDSFDEIYAYGFRNAHRIAWDTGGAGTPIVSDIGQGNIEEANVLIAGENYGWPRREGTFELDIDTDPETVLPLPLDDATFGFTYPPVQYDHDEGDAIAGGFVYRGVVTSDLLGKFVFGDIANGRIFYVDMADLLAADDGDPVTTAQVYELNLVHEGQPKTLLEILGASRADLRFGMDLVGNLYITTKTDGFVRRLVPRPSSTSTQIEVRIAQSSDDVEEYLDGRMYTNSSDLELIHGDGSDQTVGLRFQNVNIPQGATITAAYLEFETDETDSSPTLVSIAAEANDNAAAFTSANFNLTGRFATIESVAWDIPAWNTINQKHQSPDLSTVVQEVVDRTGWSANNSLVFMITGSGTRTAESYNGEPTAAPLLHVEYTTGSGGV